MWACSKGKQGLGCKLSQAKPAAKPESTKIRGEDKRVWNACFGFNSRWHDSYTKGAVEGVKRIRGPEFDSATAKGRIRRRPFDCINGEAATTPLFRVHTDIWESSRVSRYGLKYAIIFVDGYSGHISVYFMKEKSEAIDKCKEYFRDMRRAPDKKRARILRSDGAGGTEAENTYATE